MPHVRDFLANSGIFDDHGRQVRSVSRTDVLEALCWVRTSKMNGLNLERVSFDGLCLKGADLRGLKLCRDTSSRFSFEGCDLQNVQAGPMVTVNGTDLKPHDLAYCEIVRRWVSGENEPLKKSGIRVCSTDLSGAWLVGAELDLARFDHAQLIDAVLLHAKGRRCSFKGADLSGANLRVASFTQADFAGADLGDADMYQTELNDCVLSQVDWGKKLTVRQESRRDWEEASVVYLALAGAHESMGLHDLAGQFRYKRERADTRAMLNAAVEPWNAGAGRTKHALKWVKVLSPNRYRRFGKFIRRRFIEWLTGYGERPLRVLRAVALLVLFGALCYFEYTAFEWSLQGWDEFVQRTGRALYFSAVSTTALGYGEWSDLNIGPRKYLGAAQSFIGIFLNALFLVTFTRRWTR